MCPSSKLWIFSLILITLSSPSVVSQHYHYDKSTCTSENPYSESDSNQCKYSRNVSSCDTFVVYRAQKGYSTLSSIAFLFNTDTATLLSYNSNISDIDQEQQQQLDREIVVPVRCSCSGTLLTFVADDVVYNVSESESLNSIACNTFEGLVKVKYLRDYFEGKNSSIRVPLICTCPPNSTGNVRNYLVTYPIMERDDPGLIASKFGVSQEIIRNTNGLGTYDAIFPGTILFIPLDRSPVLNLPSQDSSGSTNAPEYSSSSVSRTITFYVMFGGLVFAGIVSVSVILGALIYVWWIRYNRPRGLVQILSRKKLSPDFLDGILKIKQSIKYFSLDELKIATGDFSESTVLDCGVYRGKIGDCYVVIKKVNSTAEGNGIINILSNIYHFNVLKLEGICEETRPNYLVLEFAENGSLSECLMNSKLSKHLTWKRRVQIIFDIAEGLHYLHYFTKPTYVHGNMNSRNILVTADWRGKISGFGSAKALLNCSEGSDSRGWLVSRMDVYAFGVIIVELLSGRDATNNASLVKDFLVLTEHQDPSVYLQKLENFMDPLMGGDYPMMEVLFLAFLAKGCTEDNLVNRPTMNDVLKALSNILLL